MELLTLKQAAFIKCCQHSTIWNAIKRQEINGTKDERAIQHQLGYRVKIAVIDDDKFKAWNKENNGGEEEIILKTRCKELGWSTKNPISGYLILEPLNPIRKNDRVTHARYLPLDI